MAEKKTLTCIGCPLGCALRVFEEDGALRVEGNTCPRGEAYAKSEVLWPKRTVTSTVAVHGGTVSLKHRWVNLGWGYCPTNIPQWNQKYKVAVSLLDEAGNPVRTVVDTHSDLSKWIKGTPDICLTEVPLEGLKPGKYTWALGLVDTSKGNVPGLEIAVAASHKAGGWLKVNVISIK